MSNKMISLFSIGKTQQIAEQVINNFNLDINEVKELLDELRIDFSNRLEQTGVKITESINEKISHTIECKFVEMICNVKEMQFATEERLEKIAQQALFSLQEKSESIVSDLKKQYEEIKDEALSHEENIINLCNQIAWQSNEAFTNLFETVAPLKNFKWDFSYELQEGWSSLKKADFAHAKELFAKATSQKDIMAEAYFGLALADCKIQILWDYKNCREQPLCYDYSIEFSENPNYKLALKNATETQKSEYIDFKEEIEHIQKEFEYLENSGLDYDCFICVKIKDNEKNTEDSKDADYIYHVLQRKGYKPFYSEYEIRTKKGAEYEAHILYALYKSKCMLLVCRNKEYLRTPWVKNEYLRFLKMIDDGEKKRDSLVIVFYEKKIERLPGRRGRIEGIDFAEREADFELVDFVGRQTGTANGSDCKVSEAARRAEEKRKEEEEKKRKEEEARKAAEAARVAEEKRKEEEEKKRKEEEEKKRKEEEEAKKAAEAAEKERQEYLAQFQIVDGVLLKYTGISTEVVIPEDVTSIGKNAFAYCQTLTSIVIPKGVTSIGFNAFGGCEALTSIVIPESVTSIGDDAFFGCNSLTSIMIPESVTSIGDRAFAYCKSLISIVIPEGVTSIGDFAFGGCEALTSIVIPESVTSIGDDAFFGCNSLTSIVIPEGVTSIGDFAFAGCDSLEKIEVDLGNTVYHASRNCLIETKSKTLIAGCKTSVIPDDGSVTSIGENAFFGCNSLTSIVIPESVTLIEEGAFSYCRSLEQIKVDPGNTVYHASGNCLIETKSKTLISGCKTSVIPDDGSVTSIGNDAFYGCSSLTSIVIPKSVTSIGENAFSECSSLTSIVIPESVTSIGDYAFDCCSLTSIVIPESVTSIGVYAFEGCNSLTIYCEAEKKPSGWDANWNPDDCPVVWGYGGDERKRKMDGTAANAAQRTEEEKTQKEESPFQIVDGVLQKYLGSAEEVVIPEDVTSIGRYAFYNCSLLSKVVLPTTVTEIGYKAFQGCSSLINIAIPKGLTLIEAYVFHGCNSLPSIVIPESVTSIGDSAFFGCSSLKNVTFEGKSGLTKVGDYAFGCCISLMRIAMPNGVNSIGERLFYGCSSLRNITIPDNVNLIREETFLGCSALSAITIPANVTQIDNSAFWGCSGLKSVMIEGCSQLKSIGDSAFCNSGLLGNIAIPRNVNEIGNGTFYNSSSLRNIFIPKGVTSIGDDAVLGCSSLTIYCEAEKQPSGWDAKWNPDNRPVVWGCKEVTCYNGDTYFGEFKYGQYNGRGIYRFANGAVYEGEFMNGKYNGHGRLIFADGTLLEGEFKDGKFIKHKKEKKGSL